MRVKANENGGHRSSECGGGAMCTLTGTHPDTHLYPTPVCRCAHAWLAEGHFQACAFM
jgi:hypothetical protein